MKNIDIVVGARPNFIKAFPVYEALKKTGLFYLRLINTGQHYDKNMSLVFFEQLKMKKPDINLEVGSGSHGFQTAKVLEKIEKVFLSKKPDLVIVFGDVNSTLATAIAASKLHISIAHVEAGLRSFDRTMPEEINRVLTDQISDFHFITSAEAKENLIQEGIKNDSIFFVGNTMIDSLVRFQSYFNSKKIKKTYGLERKKYILITMHRPSNVDDQKSLNHFISILNNISEVFFCVWPVHPRTSQKLMQNKIKISKKVILLDPLGYIEFMGLQKDAKAIITDSGGVQEESTYFGVPCLTIRKNTERPVTISNGTNNLVEMDYETILKKIKIFGNESNKNKVPILWDGDASKRIVKIIKEKIFKN